MEIHDFTYMPILKVYPHWWGWGGGEENEESSTKVLLTTRYLFLKSQTTYMHFIYKAFDSEAQCSIKLVANNPKETLNSDFTPYKPVLLLAILLTDPPEHGIFIGLSSTSSWSFFNKLFHLLHIVAGLDPTDHYKLNLGQSRNVLPLC